MALRLPFGKQNPDADLSLLRRLVAENARPHARRYVLAFLLMGIFAATTAASAWLIKEIVDGIFFEREVAYILTIPLIIGVMFIIRGFAAYGSIVILSRIGNAVVAKLQRRLFEKVLELDLDYFSRTHSADLVNRLSHNTAAARSALHVLANGFGKDFLTLLGLLVVMVWRSPLLSLVVLVIGPVVMIGVTGLVRRIRRIAESEFRSLGAVIRTLQETALGMRIVKAFNLERPMRERMAAAIAEVQERADKGAIVGARSGPIMETVIGLSVAAIMMWAGYSVVYLGSSPGAFLAFLAAMLLAYEPAMRLARLNVQLAQHLVGVRLLYELLDTPTSHPADAGSPPLRADRGEIVFDRVEFAYRPEIPLFTGLSFVAEAGRTTALVGPSGAGKSTVISLIERFHRPSGGRILIDGQDIAGVEVGSLRAEIALVSQDVRLFSGSVRENIRYGRLDASDAEIEEAARNALAHDFIMELPEGYATSVGEQGAQLSGGQRQRLAIARAMLRDARIVLLDEATSALDSESEHQVQVAFERLRQGRTTVVIAHRLSTVVNADRICVFVGGAIVEQGTHAELLAAGRQYARLYRLQFDPEARRSALTDEPAIAAQ